ncbi:MAG: NAD(P)H-binding protein [Solirubrobacterales bacterium]|nr:NAD(P)H-binding protein [Solirubrobacterales bacterium]
MGVGEARPSASSALGVRAPRANRSDLGRSRTDASSLSGAKPFTKGRAEDEGYGSWLNIPWNVAQVAAVRAFARERRAGDLADNKLIMALCPGLIDTDASHPWFEAMSAAQTPAQAASWPVKLALAPTFDPAFYGELVQLGKVLRWESGMKIAVIGANGRTGRIVVTDAIARGHQVIAVARTDQVSAPDDENLSNARDDVHDADALNHALDGANAVISTLGTGTSRAPTDVYSTGLSNTLGAMKSGGTVKIAVISAVPAGTWAEQPLLQRRIALPILQRFFGASYDDMRRVEAILRETTDIDWISLRPPRLVNKPPKGTYRLGTRPLAKARAITYGDLATALLDSLTRQDLYRHVAYVAN